MSIVMDDEFPVEMECHAGVSSKCLEEFLWDGETDHGYEEPGGNMIMLADGWIISEEGNVICPACCAVCAACFSVWGEG